MKMPRRPWYPPLEPQTDILGLHHISLLGAACESAAERKQRTGKVEAGVIAAFNAAVHHLGNDDARKLFNRVLQRPKRGRGKALAADRDTLLLKTYDEAPGESIASIARRLRAQGKQLGNTAAAIATQIRKLVKEREKRQRRERVEARRWRMAMRNEPPSFLSSAISSRKK